MPPAFCLYGEPFIGRVYRSLFAVCQTPEPAAIPVSVPAIPVSVLAIPVSVPAIPIPVSAVRPLRARCPSFIFPVLPRFRTIRLSAVFCRILPLLTASHRFSPLLTTSHLLLSRYLRHLPDCRPDTGTTSASDSGRRWCSCMKKRFPLTGGNRSLSRENVYSSAASGRIMTLTMLPSSRIFLARACTSALVVVRTASSWSAR